MILSHWPDWYKDIAQSKFDRDCERMAEQVERMIVLGLWDADKAREAVKKAQGLDRLQISNAVAKMHRILRGGWYEKIW